MKQHEAWWERGWEEEGITWVIVASEREAGWCEVGAFLVDAWCLGVKDAYADVLTREELDELRARQLPPERCEALEPACARKLVEGAVAYAQGLGFLPARDYRKARKVFSGVTAATCGRVFTFGHEGRPFFVAGPGDDPDRIKRVCAVLTARFGPEGFGFEDSTGEEEEEGDAAAQAVGEMMDAFYQYLGSSDAPEAAPGGYEADGFLTAVALQPEVAPPECWLPAFWGGEVPALSKDEADLVRRGTVLILADLLARFREGAYEPVLPPAEEDEGVRAEAGAEFGQGLLRGLEVFSITWKWLRDHPDGKRALEAMAQAGSGAEGLGEAVATLHRLAGELRPGRSADLRE